MLNLSNMTHPEYYNRVMYGGRSLGTLATGWDQQVRGLTPAIEHYQGLAISAELSDLAIMAAVWFAAKIFWAFWSRRPSYRYRY